MSSARFLSYRRYDVKAIRWRTPSLGVNLLLIIGAVFFLGMIHSVLKLCRFSPNLDYDVNIDPVFRNDFWPSTLLLAKHFIA